MTAPCRQGHPYHTHTGKKKVGAPMFYCHWNSMQNNRWFCSVRKCDWRNKNYTNTGAGESPPHWPIVGTHGRSARIGEQPPRQNHFWGRRARISGHAEWQRGQHNKESSFGLKDNLESDCVTKKHGLGWEVRRSQFKRIMTHLFLVILPSNIYYDCSLLCKCCHVPALTEEKNTWEQREGGTLKKKERKNTSFSKLYLPVVKGMVS